MALSLKDTKLPRCFEGSFVFDATATGATDYLFKKRRE